MPEVASAKGGGRGRGGRSYGATRAYRPSTGGSVRVRAYVRKNGTYVRSHTRNQHSGSYSFGQARKPYGRYNPGLAPAGSGSYNSPDAYQSNGIETLYPTSFKDGSTGARPANLQSNFSSQDSLNSGGRIIGSPKNSKQPTGEYCSVFIEQLNNVKTQSGNPEDLYQDSGAVNQFRVYMNWGYESFLNSKNQDALSWFKKAQVMIPQSEEASCAVQVSSLAIQKPQ